MTPVGGRKLYRPSWHAVCVSCSGAFHCPCEQRIQLRRCPRPARIDPALRQRGLEMEVSLWRPGPPVVPSRCRARDRRVPCKSGPADRLAPIPQVLDAPRRLASACQRTTPPDRRRNPTSHTSQYRPVRAWCREPERWMQVGPWRPCSTAEHCPPPAKVRVDRSPVPSGRQT
jgi:hypothetical protein